MQDFKNRKVKLAIFPLPTGKGTDNGTIVNVEGFEQWLQEKLDELSTTTCLKCKGIFPLVF